MRRGPRNFCGATDGIGLAQFGGLALTDDFFAIFLLGGLFSVSLLSPRPLLAQVCEGDEAAADVYGKSLVELVGTVQKESLEECERAYHQQACLTRLTLCYIAASEAVSCLEKAVHEPGATKGQAEADKAKRDTYVKLCDEVDKDSNALEAAKALIAKFQL